MEFKEALKLALQSLWANKLRSVLTLLGMVIGVASVITVVTLTNGAKQFVTSKINSYGASVVTITKMPQTFITLEEYLSFQRRLQGRAIRMQVVRVGWCAAKHHGEGCVSDQVHHRHRGARLDVDDAGDIEFEHRRRALVY